MYVFIARKLFINVFATKQLFISVFTTKQLFVYVFTAIYWIFEVIKLVAITNVINLKTQHSKRMCERHVASKLSYYIPFYLILTSVPES